MPLDHDYSQYDKESASQLQFIHIKTALEGIERELVKVGERVRVLEEARQRQIQLNTTFITKDMSMISKPKSRWNFFK